MGSCKSMQLLKMSQQTSSHATSIALSRIYYLYSTFFPVFLSRGPGAALLNIAQLCSEVLSGFLDGALQTLPACGVHENSHTDI